MRNEQLVDRSVPRLIESDPFTPNATETVFAVANGAFSALDVWCKIPSSWADDIEFRLYGRVGDARVQLKQLTLGEALKTTVASDTSAVLLSVRGWVVSAYEVSVRDPRTSSGQGRLLLQSLGRSSIAPDDRGAARTECAAARTQFSGRRGYAWGSSRRRADGAGSPEQHGHPSTARARCSTLRSGDGQRINNERSEAFGNCGRHPLSVDHEGQHQAR